MITNASATRPATYTAQFVNTRYANVIRFVFDGEWIVDFRVEHFFGDGCFRRSDFRRLATENGLSYTKLYNEAFALACAHAFVPEGVSI